VLWLASAGDTDGDPVRSRDMSTRIERIWGSGDLDLLFSGDRTVTPWRRGDRTKKGRSYDEADVIDLLRRPVDLIEVDPRALYCSQGWILRHHVRYYLTDTWPATGRTSADRGSELNRFPVIVTDRHGRQVIVSGHHRSAAALLAGRPVMARVAAAGPGFRVTPLVLVDPSRPSDRWPGGRLAAGHEVVVGTLEDAESALRAVGTPDDQVADVVNAATRRSHRRPGRAFCP
jgi:hypothetical protein